MDFRIQVSCVEVHLIEVQPLNLFELMVFA